MHLNSRWTTGLLVVVLCGSAAACSEADPVVETEPDGGSPGREDSSAPRGDAASGGCPSGEPTYGATCSGGELRCRLQRHGDCVAPSCPQGCKYLGIAPGAKLTSGVVYFAVCRAGVWALASEGDCSTNKDAALCECGDQDAGQ
jgi:hypothetical protein